MFYGRAKPHFYNIAWLFVVLERSLPGGKPDRISKALAIEAMSGH
jgi:hypothetical protein